MMANRRHNNNNIINIKVLGCAYNVKFFLNFFFAIAINDKQI